MLSSPSVWQSGDVVCVLVEDWETVSSYSHSVGVRKVFPDLNGTRLVFINNKNGGFLLSPANVRTYGYLTHLCTRTARHTEHMHAVYSGMICTKYPVIKYVKTRCELH